VRCTYAHTDAAYVLGALVPSERAEYEAHLSGCASCRQAVAEVAVLPGLLARLDPGTAEDLLREELSPELPVARRPLTAPGQTVASHPRSMGGPASRPLPGPARRQPPLVGRDTHPSSRAGRNARTAVRTRRTRYLAGGLLAAGVALVATLSANVFHQPVTSEPVASPATSFATVRTAPAGRMVPVANDTALKAQVQLARHGYGTEVTMDCVYDSASASDPTETVQLLAYGPNDAHEAVGSWVAAPGATVKVSGMTRFSGDQLERLELVRSADGKPLLRYEIP